MAWHGHGLAWLDDDNLGFYPRPATGSVTVHTFKFVDRLYRAALVHCHWGTSLNLAFVCQCVPVEDELVAVTA